MIVTIEEGEAILASFIGGALGFVPTSPLPTTIDTVDKVAQSAALAATGVAAIASKNPKATIAAATLSSIAATTGALKFQEDFNKLSSTDPSTWLAVVGDGVTILGDLVGIVTSIAANGTKLKSGGEAFGTFLIGAGLGITTLQIGSAQSSKLENAIIGAIGGSKAAILGLGATGTALFGASWFQTAGVLTTALTDVANLITSMNSGNFQSFSAAAGAALADINSANSSLFGLFGSSTSTAPDLTESGSSNGSATITTNDSSFTATGAVNASSGIVFGSYNVVPNFPYDLSGTDTLGADGTETLSTTAQSGTDSGSQTTQTDASGAVSSQQTTFDEITITTPLSDSIDFITNASGALVAEVPSSTPADDLIIQGAGDGSQEIFVGDPTSANSQEVIDYASGGLSGDTIAISDAGKWCVRLNYGYRKWRYGFCFL
jgi:hypothetical protein